MTTALAAAAIVPAVVATPAQAAEAEVTFAKAYYTTANGTAAFTAGELGGVIASTTNKEVTYLEGSNGEVFTMTDYSGYLAANPTATPNEILTALSKAGKALSADQVKALDVKEGKVEGGKVTVDPTAVQKTALNEAIAKAEASPKAAELKDAIAAAKAVAAKADATQAEVDAAVKALNEAIAKAEAATELKVESVKAINPTTIQVTFNGDLTEAQAAKENFTLSKGTVEAVKVEGKVATISVKGLTYGNTTTVTVGSPAHTAEVTVPQVSDLFTLEITTDAANDTIKSDGATKTQVTVTLKDKTTGELVDRDGIVQFQATDGGLGQTTSALVDGKATVQLTSVASATSITSILTATISDVPGAQEFKGLTAQKAVIFSPEAVTEGQVKFVQAVSAESTQGDRLFVTFSDKISAADYKKVVTTTTGSNIWPTAKSWGIAIDGRYVKVKDVVNKTDNTLEFILDVDSTTQVRIENTATWKTGTADVDGVLPLGTVTANYLRDNAEHTVAFPTNVGSLVLANKTGIKFIKTDTSRPAVYGVTAKDQLNLEVRYTESVKHNVAIDVENYLIDGKKLELRANPTPAQIATAKANNKIIITKIENGVYTPATATAAVKDERNLVKFVIHSDFALATGAHSIQISNILDYAGDVDVVQNKLETDTFDFNVVADESKPLASITTESPEQWLVSYDKVVSTVGTKKAKDVFKIKTNNSEDAELVYGTDYTVYQVDKTGVVGAELTATSTITNGQYFLIEFKRDWTEIYDTKANTSKTYYASTQNPYTVTLENVKSVVGNVADKQELKVTLAYDGVSPKLVTASDVYTLEGKQYLQNTGNKSAPVTVSGKEILVTFNEPIKVNSEGVAPAEGLTKSQVQNDATGNVPASTYEFVKGDKVVKAEVVTTSVAANDKSFVLRPVNGQQLEAGEWDVNIRSLTDDIGNAIATDHFKVTIVPTAQAVTGTQIAWAAFDDAEAGTTAVTDADGDKAKPNLGLDDFDAIYVKFTKEMNATGANGVNRTQNYVFMGQALPIGSKVLQGIEGVTNKWDGVTILVPKGTWDGASNDYSVALNIASNFTAADGENLSGAYEVELFDGDVTTVKSETALEAVYTQGNGLIVSGSTKAAVLKAEALDTDTNGKVDQVKLTTNVTVTPTVGDEILVNGQTFVYASGNGTVANPLLFNAKAATNEITGTAASNLKVTNTNGAILVNSGSVVDSSAPVITKAQLSTDKTKVTLTFSEAIYKDNTLATLTAADAAMFKVGGTDATSVEQTSPTTVVLTVSNGATLSTASTVDVGTGGAVVDASNVAFGVAFSPITGVPAAADAAAAAPVIAAITGATTPTAVGTARTNYDTLSTAQKALVTNYALLQTKEADAAKVTAAKGSLALTYAASETATTVKSNITLGTDATVDTITWASTNTAVATNGAVTRAITNTTGDLTATITKGAISDTKDFAVTVLAKTFSLVPNALTGVTITNDGTTSGIPAATQSAPIDGISLTLTPDTDKVDFVVTGTKVDAITTGDITVDVTLDGVTKQFKVTISAAGVITAVTPV